MFNLPILPYIYDIADQKFNLAKAAFFVLVGYMSTGKTEKNTEMVKRRHHVTTIFIMFTLQSFKMNNLC